MSKKSVKQSLLDQLKAKGANSEYFADMVSKYMGLWEVSDLLEKDIKERGVKYQDTYSTGQNGLKDNTSVQQIVKVNNQMLNILKNLGLNEPTESDGDGSDLI